MFSDKVSCTPVGLRLPSCVPCLGPCLSSLTSAEAAHVSSLLSCSPRPQREGKRRVCGGCTVYLGTLVCISHILPLHSAGLSGSIYPRYRSLLCHRPRKGMKEAAPCQGRSHLCQSNPLLLLELVIGVDAPGHLSSGSFCSTGTLGPPGRSGAFGSVAGGMSGLLRSDGKSHVPFKENGDLAKKEVGRCVIGSVV